MRPWCWNGSTRKKYSQDSSSTSLSCRIFSAEEHTSAFSTANVSRSEHPSA